MNSLRMNSLRMISRPIYTNSIGLMGFPRASYISRVSQIPYEEQWESRDNENEIRFKPNENNEIRFSTPYKSYGEWLKENKGTTSKERRIKMKEYLDQFYSGESN